jgi:excisionase family DNA binding protein
MGRISDKAALLAQMAEIMNMTNRLFIALSEFTGEPSIAPSGATNETKPAPVKEFLSAKEAAEMTGYSEAYMYQLIHARKIPCHRPSGKNRSRIVFYRSELEQFLMNNKQRVAYELDEKAVGILNSNSVRQRRPRRRRTKGLAISETRAAIPATIREPESALADAILNGEAE